MKKLNFVCTAALTLVVMMAFVVTAQAQIGVKAGLSTSVIAGYGNTEEGETASLKVGYQGGIFYKLPVVEKINIFVELNYESRGTVSKKDYMTQLPVIDPSSGSVLGIGNYTVSQEIRSTQNYLNVPILVAFGGDKLKVYAGPNFGYMLTGKASIERTIDISLGGNNLPTVSTSLDDIDWKDYDSFKRIFTSTPPEDGDFINSLSVGFNVGAMFNVTEDLFIDLRVNQGLTDESNNSYDNSIYPNADFSFPSREDTDRTFGIQLGLGYTF
jgi:hypothetical protein